MVPEPNETRAECQKELHLPTPKKYFTEQEVCDLLRCTKRAFRQREDSAKPPCIRLSARRKLWDPQVVEAWLSSRLTEAK